MKRIVAALNRVPPLWWARFVFLSLIVSLVTSAWALYAINRAAQDAGEALWLKNRAIAVLDSLNAKQCIMKRTNERIVRYRVKP